jgi:flagellar hook protein FlgE
VGLGSVLQTSLSGMAAAETIVAVTANNVANVRTPGFKASRVVLTTQTPSTLSLGSAGGTNPAQIGLGVMVAATPLDFSQGSIVEDPNPLSIALEGEGLFILEGEGGERVYTRDGHFHLNASGELVNAKGYRVLGFGVDANFRIQRGQLQPLRLPVGRTVRGVDGEATAMSHFDIERDGRIRGFFSDGQWRDLGQIRLSRFANLSGLAQRAGKLYSASPNSGLPVENDPGEGGAAEIRSGATELSNTDIGRSLIELENASTQFRANQIAMKTGLQLLDELMNQRRVPG